MPKYFWKSEPEFGSKVIFAHLVKKGKSLSTSKGFDKKDKYLTVACGKYSFFISKPSSNRDKVSIGTKGEVEKSGIKICQRCIQAGKIKDIPLGLICPLCGEVGKCSCGDVGGVEYYDKYVFNCNSCDYTDYHLEYGGSPVADNWVTTCPYCGKECYEHRKE